MNIIVWACFILSGFKSSILKCPIDSVCVVTAGLIYSARESERERASERGRSRLLFQGCTTYGKSMQGCVANVHRFCTMPAFL